ncbi:MAG: DUF1800 domain-containing protein [Microscillaceae bacterium]|nr:DUF1800 domain-containing protein [Microscillaceae bacterium]
MPLTPFNGTLGKKRAAHLLRRATFGPTMAEIDTFANYTAPQALAQLFADGLVPLPPIDPATGQTWIGVSPAEGSSDDEELQGFFKAWWMAQMLRPGASAREKVVFFLHSHFTTIQSFVENSRALYYQNVLFRYFAFDQNDPLRNFKTLTKKLCIDNAMLKFLDGELNVTGAVNENFARELLELYTIGKGREGVPLPGPLTLGDYYYFTEQDVVAGARVFSGFDLDNAFANLDPDTNLPRAIVKGFAQNGFGNRHDNDPKEFSARLGNVSITPNPALLDAQGRPTEASMLDEIDQFVEMVYAQAETPQHICRKIYRFFVYHNISDEINNTIIPAMADTFVNSGYKLQAVLEDLLASQHFFDAATATPEDDNFGAIIKSPLDLQIGTLRFFEAERPDDQSQAAEWYEMAGRLMRKLEFQGMSLLEPFEVAGYPAYHQFPEFHRNWISTNSLTQRYLFIREIMTIEGLEPGDLGIDLLAFTKTRFSNAVALDPDQLVRAYVSYLFPQFEEGAEITPERLAYFRQQFLRLGEGLPQGPVLFWQFSYTNAEVILQSGLDARGMLQDLVNAILQSPEYQLF